MSALPEAYDELAPATRALLIAHRELAVEQTVFGPSHRERKAAVNAAKQVLARARERWTQVGCPDLDTAPAIVGVLLRASKAVQVAGEALRADDSLMAFFGVVDHGLKHAALRESQARAGWVWARHTDQRQYSRLLEEGPCPN